MDLLAHEVTAAHRFSQAEMCTSEDLGIDEMRDGREPRVIKSAPF